MINSGGFFNYSSARSHISWDALKGQVRELSKGQSKNSTGWDYLDVRLYCYSYTIKTNHITAPTSEGRIMYTKEAH